MMTLAAASLTVYFFRMSGNQRDRFTAPVQALRFTLALGLAMSVPGAGRAQNVNLQGAQFPAQEQAQPLDEASSELIQSARNRVLDSMKRAPRYTCTETIDRQTWDSRRETHSCATRAVADRLESQDRLRLDVAVSQGGEIFSWHGEKQFAEGEIGDLVNYGMIGSGLFSSFLAGIFGDSRYLNRFSYINTSKVDGEELAEYQFVMQAAASHWLMRTGAAHAVVPYHGSVWIDSETATLKRIHIVADDLPPSLGTCSVEVDLRYHIIQLGSNEFVIPERAETVSTGPTGLRGVSETKFLQCHEFMGESTLHFEGLDDSPAATEAVMPTQTRDLPAGLHISVDLETHLDAKENWVGDPIAGRLRDSIKLSNDVVAPKGARVTGRLVALQTYMKPDERLEVGFDWQQIEGAPATVLRLRAEYSDISRDVTFASHGHRSGGGNMLQSIPMAVEGKPMVFVLEGSHRTLPRNLTTNWVTVPLKKEAAKSESGASVR